MSRTLCSGTPDACPDSSVAGLAQASVDEAWQYTTGRIAFERPIAQFQGVSFPLAEAETQLTMMRQLCYYTLSLRDRGLAHTAEAAMCSMSAVREML